MTLRFVQWTIDVVNLDLMVSFWSAALGYQVDSGDDGCAKLYPPAGSSPLLPTVWLQTTGEIKSEKNHNHPDLRPADGDVRAEVQRLISLGARHADVGQTASDPFVVLADPEGNEFCVLHRDPSRGPTTRPTHEHPASVNPSAANAGSRGGGTTESDGSMRSGQHKARPT